MAPLVWGRGFFSDWDGTRTHTHTQWRARGRDVFFFAAPPPPRRQVSYYSPRKSPSTVWPPSRRDSSVHRAMATALPEAPVRAAAAVASHAPGGTIYAPINFIYSHFHNSIRSELDLLATSVRGLDPAGGPHLEARLQELRQRYRFLEQLYKYHSSVEDEVRSVAGCRRRVGVGDVHAISTLGFAKCRGKRTPLAACQPRCTLLPALPSAPALLPPRSRYRAGGGRPLGPPNWPVPLRLPPPGLRRRLTTPRPPPAYRLHKRRSSTPRWTPR